MRLSRFLSAISVHRQFGPNRNAFFIFLKKPVALGFGYAYTAPPTNAGLVGFAVVGLGDAGFFQYRRGSLKVSAFGQVGLNDRAVGRFGCWIWFW
jgi:hypothetical protein